MDSNLNSQFVSLSANFTIPVASGPSLKSISIDSLTSEFFEDLQGVSNECECTLLSSKKEMEDLESENNLLSVMEQKLCKQIQLLIQYNKELQVKLSKKKTKLQKRALCIKIARKLRKTANCKETQC
ncbi:unnamed protein product [Blepharisma stoltei]|uniref:Uncharacterized protein n=1 Tax=Blepharisma stoltei TaxID=1481888 RepID=A0AAU9K0B6_9CILI|nr:unnamed protein product [Blepharisma stoltei]